MSIGPNPPSGATLPIRRAWADVYSRWGTQVSNAGTSSCRHVNFDRAAPWSEHAWGNAWDITGPTAVLDRVAAFLNGKPYAAQVLWKGRNLVSGNPVSGHTDHIHLSGAPLRNPGGNSVPPCAGGTAGPLPGVVRAEGLKLPAPAQTVAGETWAPGAKIAARELVQSAERIGRAAGSLRRMMARR